MNRKERRERARRRARQKKIAPIVMMVAGLALLAWVGYGYLANRGATGATLDYAPEDVVYDQPIHAIHEMGDGPPIPFLPKDQPQPDIVVPETFHNFGSIGPTEVVQRTFVVGNVGDAPLTISRVYTTCGCTTADVTASVIPPGKVVLVTLTFDAGFHDTAGQTVRRGIIIENNDPRESQAEIWVQAAVRSG